MARAGSNVTWSIRFPRGTTRSSSRKSPTSVRERASRSFWNRSAGITGAERRRLGDRRAPQQPPAHQEIRDKRHDHQDDGERGREFEGAGLSLRENGDWRGLQDSRHHDHRSAELGKAPTENEDTARDKPGLQQRQREHKENEKTT